MSKFQIIFVHVTIICSVVQWGALDSIKLIIHYELALSHISCHYAYHQVREFPGCKLSRNFFGRAVIQVFQKGCWKNILKKVSLFGINFGQKPIFFWSKYPQNLADCPAQELKVGPRSGLNLLVF